MVDMTSNSLSQSLTDSLAISAPRFSVTLTSLSAVDSTSVSPASSTGSRSRRHAHTAVKRTSTIYATKQSNVIPIDLKFDAPSKDWAVSGWEN